MENIAGEQTLLTSNIFHAICNIFWKSQTSIKIHSLMPGVSNLAILLLLTCFFSFLPLCHDHFLWLTRSCDGVMQRAHSPDWLSYNFVEWIAISSNLLTTAMLFTILWYTYHCSHFSRRETVLYISCPYPLPTKFVFLTSWMLKVDRPAVFTLEDGCIY